MRLAECVLRVSAAQIIQSTFYNDTGLSKSTANREMCGGRCIFHSARIEFLSINHNHNLCGASTVCVSYWPVAGIINSLESVSVGFEHFFVNI